MILHLQSRLIKQVDIFTEAYIDSFGVFTPSLASLKDNLVYYTMLSGGSWIKDSITVVVDSIPDASITAAGPFCQGDKLHVLTGAVNKNGTFISQKFQSTSGVFYPSIALQGNHKVFYTCTDGNGCKNTDSSIIRVNGLPSARIVDPGPLCLNDGKKQIKTTLSGGSFRISS